MLLSGKRSLIQNPFFHLRPTYRRSFLFTSSNGRTMVPETEFTAAISRPLNVIQALYEKAADKSPTAFSRNVESHFRQLFPDVEAKTKIPCLSASSISSLLPQLGSNASPPSSLSHEAKLVRWRCMVQDTGLGTEVFLPSTNQADNLLCTMFGAEVGLSLQKGDQSLENTDQFNLAERCVLYATSVPGQSRWAREAHGEDKPSSEAESDSDGDVKRLQSQLALTSLQDPESPERIRQVRQRVKSAVENAKAIGAGEKEPRLVAISKLHPPSSILAAYQKAGQLHFGENYVQEMVDKSKVLPLEIKWHFVGGLQSNKGKLLASIPNLYLLETLDSIKAANVLEKALSSPDAAQRTEPLQVYLQVNTSGEDAKSGLAAILDTKDVPGNSRPLLELAIHVITKCPHLRFRGVMTIGSASNSTESVTDAKGTVADIVAANPDFEKLINTRKNLVTLLRDSQELIRSKAAHIQEAYMSLFSPESGETGGLELSMGMSADLEVAVMAGSDNVRVGTDCFGRRPPSREEAMAGMKRELEIGIEAARAELCKSLDNGESVGLKDPYPQKAPLPEEKHVGGLVKVYDIDIAEKIKTSELVEVVGILETATLPHAEWQDVGSSNGQSASLPEVACIHAVFVDRIDLNALPRNLSLNFGPTNDENLLSDETQRSELIKYLADGLGGDQVAAELVLLAAIARIHARRANLSLGLLNLNISNFPAPQTTDMTKQPKIYRRLAELLPSIVEVDMDLTSLNDVKKSLYPRSSGGELGLEAGRLQLPHGTMALINEGVMKEGDLREIGVRNVKALSTVLESHKLPYVFPYSEFEFETDLNVVILSQGKSFLPFHIQCPLEPEQAGLYNQETNNDMDVSMDKLNAWRKALLHARCLSVAKAFEIPESVSEYIQKEFVEQRKRELSSSSTTKTTTSSTSFGQEDLLRRMTIVRLLAISRNEKVLTIDSWKKAVELDNLVTERIRKIQQQHQPN